MRSAALLLQVVVAGTYGRAVPVERNKLRLYAGGGQLAAAVVEGGDTAVHCYGLRVAVLAGALCSLALLAASVWFGMAGLAVASALIVAIGWIIYLHSERTVLTALRARPVGEVERPELYRLVRELCYSARLPVPRLFVAPAMQPNILTVGCSTRSATICCTEGLLRVLSVEELRAVIAHELAHVSRRDGSACQLGG